MNPAGRFIAIKEAFLRVVNKFHRLEKVPIDHGTGDLLYPAEINTIEVIGKTPGINVTRLAKRQGVTAGAVSQVLGKLERKGLITKYHEASNRKEVLIRLTEKGWIAFRNHERFHLEYDMDMLKEMSCLSPEQIAFIQEFLDMLERTLDKYLDDLT